jgi:hypothetical protein
MARVEKTDLDREGVINGLTDGVGAAFGRVSRRSFYEQLKRMEGEGRFQKAKHEEQQFLVDLLAVASFYQCVIIPVESSRSFMGVLRRAGATHLRVAGDKLDWRYSTRAQAVTIGFSRVLREMQVPIRLFTYPTLKRFMLNALQFYRGRTSEPSLD